MTNPRGTTATRGMVKRRRPAGCPNRGGRRRELISALRRLRESGSRFDALTFDDAVDRGAANSEVFGDLEGAVTAAVHQRDQVRLLFPAELGLLSPQPPLDLRATGSPRNGEQVSDPGRWVPLHQMCAGILLTGVHE